MGQWQVIRIAGVAGNGFLDPDERWDDANNDGVLDPGEDKGTFSGFPVDVRVAVAARLDPPSCGAYIVAFIGASVDDKKGLYAAEAQVDLVTLKDSVVDIVKVAEIGDTVGANGAKISDLTIYDSVNSRGQIAFWAQTDHGQVVVRAQPERRPVLVLPGVAGSFSPSSQFSDWAVQRGFPPDQLAPDYALHVYDDLAKTLRNAGYCDKACAGSGGKLENLYVAVYDWRLPPGPDDGVIDGKISGINGETISDGVYEYSVDYLGYWLKRASDAWAQRYPGTALENVDVIAHSTGGLVARTYIESDAYGDTLPGPGKRKLPKIYNLVMVAVPNRGASKAWNPLHNNWNGDGAYRFFLSKMLKIPYKYVTQQQTHHRRAAADHAGLDCGCHGPAQPDAVYRPVCSDDPQSAGDLSFSR